jgi:type II secretory pathway pseudopilin PulG
MLSFIVIIIFVFLLAILATYNKSLLNKNEITLLRESAKAYYNQILIARYLNSSLNGVYAKVTETLHLNPYLDTPNRDIITKNGELYTMKNPAYMTRQISEIADKKSIFSFHITSLKPVDPNNKPDDW